VLTNDTDGDLPGDTLTAVLVSAPTHAGNFTLHADGMFSYTHDGSETFSDSFTYQINDGLHDSATATVSITVTPVNDQTPVANAESLSVAEGATATTLTGGAASVLTNDTDGDLPGDTLTAVLVSGP